MKNAISIAGNWRTWAVIGTLLIAFLIYRNGRRWLAQITRRDEGNYEGQSSVNANAARKAELEKMAQDTYTVLNSTLMLGGVTATGREWQLEQLLALNDTELRWVARRYAELDDGISLKDAVDAEYMPFSNVDERLIVKLTQLAL